MLWSRYANFWKGQKLWVPHYKMVNAQERLISFIAGDSNQFHGWDPPQTLSAKLGTCTATIWLGLFMVPSTKQVEYRIYRNSSTRILTHMIVQHFCRRGFL